MLILFGGNDSEQNKKNHNHPSINYMGVGMGKVSKAESFQTV